MIWKQLARAYDEAPDELPGDERVRIAQAAAALWAKASTEDFDWVARSLEQLSDLDFLSSLLFYVENAPPRFLEPLISAAVHAPLDGAQLERVFTEHASKFYGAQVADEVLLRYVAQGSFVELQRSTHILVVWTHPSPAMKDRRQMVYARRFLRDEDHEVASCLVPLLLFDADPFPEAEKEIIRRALEKAQRHPTEAVRAAADHQLRYAALLRRMPTWIRPMWERFGEGSFADPERTWPEHEDDDAVPWITEALGYANESLHHFAALVLAEAPADLRVSASLRQALADAAVRERNPSANRMFVEPASARFGADAVVDDLLDRMRPGNDDASISGAAQALYWVDGPQSPATTRRWMEAILRCFVTGSPWLQRFLVWRFPWDLDDSPPELRPLVEEIRSIARSHEDEEVRRWAREG
ncbi:Hypothetical protein A7982_07815 [Minicystis rosea]|nr:Hypothetical protein A7982_07815 [Minicystis rosea]